MDVKPTFSFGWRVYYQGVRFFLIFILFLGIVGSAMAWFGRLAHVDEIMVVLIPGCLLLMVPLHIRSGALRWTRDFRFKVGSVAPRRAPVVFGVFLLSLVYFAVLACVTTGKADGVGLDHEMKMELICGAIMMAVSAVCLMALVAYRVGGEGMKR